MSPCHRLIGSAVALAVTGVTPVFAQTTTPVEPEKAPLNFTLGFGANYAADADFKDGGGSFSVFRSDGSLRLDHAFSRATSASLTLDGEWSHYFFRDLAAVPGDDGSDSLDVFQVDLRPMVRHYLSENLGVFGGFTLTAAGMSEADFGESLSYGVFGGVNYQIAPKVWIGGGLSVSTRLEDSAFVVPLLTIRWDITPQLSLASDGLGIKATYKVDDAWGVYVRGRYDYRQFRLDSNEIISDGVLTDQAIPLAIGVTYNLDDALAVSAEAGVVAWRRLEFDDAGGDQAGAQEADPAAFFSVQLKYSF